MADGRSSVRAQKKAQLREALIEAAYDLFDSKGFENTTVDEIAESAGVSRRTFFRYFGTKEAIVFPRSAERIEGFRSLLETELSNHPPLIAIREAAIGTASFFVSEREEEVRRQRIIDGSPTLVAADLEVNQRWENEMARAVAPADSSDDDRRKAQLLAAVCIGIISAVLRDWRQGGGERDLVQLGREAFHLLERGFDDMQGP